MTERDTSFESPLILTSGEQKNPSFPIGNRALPVHSIVR